jgi:DNA-binding CsgD family transcriptional regulator/pimeloyl-ACP methyl ester carboxylesterase
MPGEHIGFCATRSGVRLAFAVRGSGPPLVLVRNYHSHLERDARSPVWKPWLDALARDRTLIRYDERGSGLSDRGVEDQSLETLVADLEDLVDHLRLTRFDLLSQVSGCLVAIPYASRHAAKVKRLVLDGGYARGRFLRGAAAAAMGEACIHLAELGWDGVDPIGRHMLGASLVMPDAPLAVQEAFATDLRAARAGEDMARMFRTNYSADVRALATTLGCPTLILQSLHGSMLSFEEARITASLIPGARLVPLESRNEILVPGEPAWDVRLAEVRAFLARSADDEEPFSRLSAREAEVLDLISEGFDNFQIAARLAISEKTVRNHITRLFAKIEVQTRAQAIVLAQRARGRRPVAFS